MNRKEGEKGDVLSELKSLLNKNQNTAIKLREEQEKINAERERNRKVLVKKGERTRVRAAVLENLEQTEKGENKRERELKKRNEESIDFEATRQAVFNKLRGKEVPDKELTKRGEGFEARRQAVIKKRDEQINQRAEKNRKMAQEMKDLKEGWKYEKREPKENVNPKDIGTQKKSMGNVLSGLSKHADEFHAKAAKRAEKKVTDKDLDELDTLAASDDENNLKELDAMLAAKKAKYDDEMKRVNELFESLSEDQQQVMQDSVNQANEAYVEFTDARTLDIPLDPSGKPLDESLFEDIEMKATPAPSPKPSPRSAMDDMDDFLNEAAKTKPIHREELTPQAKAAADYLAKNIEAQAKHIKIGNKRGTETFHKKETESPKVSRRAASPVETPPPRPSIPEPFVPEARNRSNAFFKEQPKKEPEADKKPKPGPLIGRRK